MKINVERGAFLKALSHVQSVVERRNTIPILSNVLIEAGKGELKLTATDLDIEIVEGLPADVLRNGSATAPAHMLYDIVRKLPDGAQVQVELLSSEGGRLAVSAGTSRFELSCLPREDFPQMAAGALPHKFRLAADDLKRIIAKTRFAISTEETRYYLNGIYVHAAKDAKPPVMRAVATDGHRLARYELELADGRWLRMTGSATSEGGSIIFLSDFTAIKEREESLRRAKQEAEIIEPTPIVDFVDPHAGIEQADEERDGANKAMPEPGPKTRRPRA